MYGLFQTMFYFGYMALFSIGLGVMCGKLNKIVVADLIPQLFSLIT